MAAPSKPLSIKPAVEGMVVEYSIWVLLLAVIKLEILQINVFHWSSAVIMCRMVFNMRF